MTEPIRYNMRTAIDDHHKSHYIMSKQFILLRQYLNCIKFISYRAVICI